VNYAELVQRIQDYLESDEPELVANIPTFVKSVEQKVFNATQLPAVRTISNLTTVLSTPTVAVPSDYLSAFSAAVINAGNHQYLLNKDINFIREAYPNQSITGVPRFYAQLDEDTLLLGPTPNATFTVVLDYFRYPDSIVDNGTSWLGDNFDSVLLYGSLVEANIFQKGEQDLQQAYEQQFQSAFVLLKQLSDGKLRQDAYRSGQIRLPVS
jgi:hypothetical protein